MSCCGYWRNIPMLTLPTIYDDSLSYYEEICQLISQVNALREALNQVVEEIESSDRQYTDGEIAKLRDEMNLLIEQQEQKLSDLALQIVNLYNTIITNDGIYRNLIAELEFRLRQYVQLLIRNGCPLIKNPWTGRMETCEDVFNYLAEHAMPNGLTAREYDSMMLTAQEYDSYHVTATQYIKDGRWIFWKRLYLRMRNPFNGLLEYYDKVIYQLAMLHKYVLTAEEYDNLLLTATAYDGKNITAYEFDWDSKSFLP